MFIARSVVRTVKQCSENWYVVNTALTNQENSTRGVPQRRSCRILRGILWLLGFVALLAAVLLWRGGYWLIKNDPPPPYADAAVVLQGSIVGQMARVDGAARLLQQGVAARMLLSVPKQSYWDESVVPMAQRYLENHFGKDIASRVDFCETDPEVNSTGQEAQVLGRCIREHGWQSIVVVTSNYHTRRASIIWRKMLQKNGPVIQLWLFGVDDPEFRPRAWWSKRLYAKTWVSEFSKLVWVELGGS
jgi:uncharacterized SAM-binding protein YcdF (DUF218 family)